MVVHGECLDLEGDETPRYSEVKVLATEMSEVLKVDKVRRGVAMPPWEHGRTDMLISASCQDKMPHRGEHGLKA